MAAALTTYLLRFFDLIFIAITGLAVADLFDFAGGNNPVFNFFDRIDIVVKSGVGIVAMIYGVIRAHHSFYDNKINRQIKREELRKIRHENDRDEK